MYFSFILSCYCSLRWFLSLHLQMFMIRSWAGIPETMFNRNEKFPSCDVHASIVLEALPFLFPFPIWQIFETSPDIIWSRHWKMHNRNFTIKIRIIFTPKGAQSHHTLWALDLSNKTLNVMYKYWKCIIFISYMHPGFLPLYLQNSSPTCWAHLGACQSWWRWVGKVFWWTMGCEKS